jgi:hypothetical protein
MLKEIIVLLIGSNPVFAALNPAGFGLSSIGAVAFACFLWWLCNKFTSLWNRSFYLNWFHHVVCAVAALVTIFLCITFASVGEIGQVLDQVVTEWGSQMREGSGSNISQRASLGDVSSGYTSDGQSVASDSDLAHQFEGTHPFLCEVVQLDNVDSYGNSQPGEPDSSAGQMIDRVAAGLKDELQGQARHVVFLLRFVLFLSFVLVQGIVFSLTGYAAHRNIRPCS